MLNRKTLLGLLIILLIPNLYAHDHEVLFIQQQYDDIIKECTPPQKNSDYYWAAQAYKAKGEQLSALKILESCPDTAAVSDIEALKAEIYYSLGRYSLAENYYSLTSENDASFYKLMQVYENKGNYLKCIGSITNRIDSTSTNTALLAILANSYYRSNAKIMAQNTYQRLYDIDPKNTAIAYKLAVLMMNTMKAGQIKQAANLANEVLEAEPNNMRFIRVRARAYYLLEEYREAMQDYETLYKKGYQDEVTCQRLGMCEYKLHFFREASQHFTDALLQNVNSMHSNLYLGMCYQNLGECNKSLYYLAQADSLMQPTDEHLATLCWERQWCYIKQQQYHKADSCLHAMLKYSDDILNYYHIATNYDKNLKDKNKAITYYQLFIDQNNETKKLKEDSGFIRNASYRIKRLEEDKFWGE